MHLVPVRCLAVAVALALALAALAALAAPAAAEDARGMVAHFARTDAAKVSEARGYHLDGVRDYTDIVVGTYRAGEHDHRVLVLLRCGARTCSGTTVHLEPGVAAVRGLVDLNGPDAALDSGRDVAPRGAWDTTLPGQGLAWPALVLEVRDERKATGESRFGKRYRGTERHHHLVVVSLRKADAAAPRLAQLPTTDRYPSGAGTTTGYRLARGPRKEALEIVGREQRHLDNDSHCLRPEPVEIRWVLTAGRYQRVDELLGSHGCR